MRIEFRKNNKSVLSATLLLLASTMLLNFARAQEAPATKPTPSEVTMTAEAVAAPVATAPTPTDPQTVTFDKINSGDTAWMLVS